MDNAVALVAAYLHVNGYFTVTEYPVLEAVRDGQYRTLTDLDILAFRFPRAGRLTPGRKGDRVSCDIDPELGCDPRQADMLVGEVKEGRAELNRGATDPAVLRAVLARFGCCPPEHVDGLVRQLIRKGEAESPVGHRLRLVAFGVDGGTAANYRIISLGHVVQFLQDYLREHWQVLHHAQFKDPAFGFLMTLEKALRRKQQ